MNYVDVIRYCLALPNTRRETTSASGNAFAINYAEVPFGTFRTGAPVQWKFSLRVSEMQHRDMHNPPRIFQAKTEDQWDNDYWLTIARVESCDEAQLKEMIDWSYQRTCKLQAAGNQPRGASI